MVSIRQIPIIGNDIYQVGQVIDIVSQPCSPQPMIAAKAFFANIPMLIWTLVKPDPVDYVTTRFGRPHKRIRRRRIGGPIVDVGLPSGGGGIRWVEWRSFKFLERIGWYFLVADATSDFLINWTSMAYQFSGCPAIYPGYGSAQRTQPQVFNRLAGNWNMGGADIVSFTPGWHANASFVTKNAAGPRMVTGNVSFGEAPSPAASINNVYVHEDFGGFSELHEMEATGANPGGGRGFSINLRSYDILKPPAVYNLVVQAGAGNWSVNSWNLEGSGPDSDGVEHDP